LLGLHVEPPIGRVVGPIDMPARGPPYDEHSGHLSNYGIDGGQQLMEN
jgi:hypothetical protein